MKQMQKKQEKIIEDKTFGLKNKNKSKSVQKYIASMQSNIGQSHNPEMKRKMAEVEKRKQAKQAKEQSEKELQKLFRDVNSDRKKDEKEDPKVFDEVTGEYLWQPEDFAEIERDDRRLEEQIDDKLTEIRSSRTEFVVITHEAFLKWLDKRASGTSSKSKSVSKKASVSGKNLWQSDAAAFVDDENAADEEEYVLLDEDDECAEGMQKVAIDTSLFDGNA